MERKSGGQRGRWVEGRRERETTIETERERGRHREGEIARKM